MRPQSCGETGNEGPGRGVGPKIRGSRIANRLGSSGRGAVDVLTLTRSWIIGEGLEGGSVGVTAGVSRSRVVVVDDSLAATQIRVSRILANRLGSSIRSNRQRQRGGRERNGREKQEEG